MIELWVFVGILVLILTVVYIKLYISFVDDEDGKKMCIFFYVFSVLLFVLYCFGVGFY